MDTRHLQPTQSTQGQSPCFNTFGLRAPVLPKVKVIQMLMGCFLLCFLVYVFINLLPVSAQLCILLPIIWLLYFSFVYATFFSNRNPPTKVHC